MALWLRFELEKPNVFNGAVLVELRGIEPPRTTMGLRGKMAQNPGKLVARKAVSAFMELVRQLRLAGRHLDA